MSANNRATGALDLRPVLPPVRDQGQRNTCVAFAVSAAHEVARAAGKVAAEDLSEEALYWGCKRIDGNWGPGSRFTSAAAALSRWGQPLESVWPYDETLPDGGPYHPPTPPEASTWFRSGLRQVSLDAAELRDCLDGGASVALELVLFDTFFTPGATGIVLEPPAGAPPRGRHAVLAVGYDAGSLLVRNSWGNAWALRGYAWLSNAYVLHHGRSAWIIDAGVVR